jgi:acetyl-CoA acyltransferase
MHSVTMTAASVAASDKNPRFLSNPEFKDFLKVSDCSQVSDGASALVLVSEAGLEKLGRRPADAVELVGQGHATAPLAEDPSDPASLTTTAAAARSAYEAAGMGPDEMGVAEVHDCFSITEILMYEALGFADAGEGVRLVREGSTELTGNIPVSSWRWPARSVARPAATNSKRRHRPGSAPTWVATTARRW